MITFDEILTTQLSIRNFDQVADMKKFVSDGGYFDRNELDRYAESKGIRPGPLVQINRFEDGKLFLLDGHHRGIGIYEGGRRFFHESEYRIIEYTYEDFVDIVFLREDESWMGWVTPFDPRTHVRHPDIGHFKNKVKEIYESQSHEAAIYFIEKNMEQYCMKRTDLMRPIDTIQQLTNVWKQDMEELQKLRPIAKAAG